jgi:16S rRNA (guanine966-N2)-methyltransferase
MSSLLSLRGSWDDARVLDAFAGSGALGIEALSRGASFACLCDRDKQALAMLKANTSFIESDHFCINRVDVLSRLPRCRQGAYDIVFLDPPYALDPDDVCSLLETMIRDDYVDRQALCVYEHDNRFDLETLPAFSRLEWELVKHKAYGDTIVDIVKRKSV